MNGEPEQPVGVDPGAPGMEAFDRWLQQNLRELHGAVVQEAIPAELLRILDEDCSGRGR